MENLVNTMKKIDSIIRN